MTTSRTSPPINPPSPNAGDETSGAQDQESADTTSVSDPCKFRQSVCANAITTSGQWVGMSTALRDSMVLKAPSTARKTHALEAGALVLQRPLEDHATDEEAIRACHSQFSARPRAGEPALGVLPKSTPRPGSVSSWPRRGGGAHSSRVGTALQRPGRRRCAKFHAELYTWTTSKADSSRIGTHSTTTGPSPRPNSQRGGHSRIADAGPRRLGPLLPNGGPRRRIGPLTRPIPAPRPGRTGT